MTGQLRECPRCLGWCLDPDDPTGHILGTTFPWPGGGPLPDVVYCTPAGRERRPLPQPEPLEDWRWTTSGYRRIGGEVVE